MVERIPWDQYFLAQSLMLSLRSTCERLMVGAVIVRDNRIIAGGYNGSVSGDEHCIDVGCYVEDGHCMRTIHAEMNALLQCARFGASTDGAEIYVTHRPCLQCTKSLLQAGIQRITYLYDYHNHPYAEKLLKQQRVTIQKGEIPENFFQMFEQMHSANVKKELAEQQVSNKQDERDTK